MSAYINSMILSAYTVLSIFLVLHTHYLVDLLTNDPARQAKMIPLLLMESRETNVFLRPRLVSSKQLSLLATVPHQCQHSCCAAVYRWASTFWGIGQSRHKKYSLGEFLKHQFIKISTLQRKKIREDHFGNILNILYSTDGKPVY